jgi:hypothetical protein
MSRPSDSTGMGINYYITMGEIKNPIQTLVLHAAP